MKKSKIILIIAIVVILAIIAIFAYSIVSELGQENKLNEEMNEISTIIASNDYTEEEINQRLDERVTDGDYGKVENAAKTYLKDVIKLNIELSQIVNNGELSTMLTSNNYQEDGPEFTKTKEYISSTTQRLEEMKQEYEEYMSTEKVMSYIEKENVDEYYVELYKTIMGESSYEEISSSIDELIDVLNKSNDIIDFLIENKGSWEIQDDMIVFSTNEQIEEYNNLIAQLSA